MKNRFFLQSEILELLPNTQCQRCGWETCADFAAGLLESKSSINDCLPGGERVRKALAKLLDQELVPPGPILKEEKARVAFIDETNCIGCAKCLPVCPVDSIIGTKGKTHTVVEQWCTGCKLCASACPTDCIDFESSLLTDIVISKESAALRFFEKQQRLEIKNKDKEKVENFIEVEEDVKQEYLTNLLLKLDNDSLSDE